MTDIEIPLQSEKDWKYRFFEALPGLISWSILALPFVLSLFTTRLIVLLIIIYFLIWFVRAIGLNIRVLQGFRLMKQHEKLNWQELIDELANREQSASLPAANRPKWHLNNLKRLSTKANPVKPADVIHAVMVPTHHESRAVLEPTIQSILASEYDPKKIIFILAYEERGGPEVEEQAKQLVEEYEHKFYGALAIKHPQDIPNELKGKGGNSTYAGRQLAKYLKKEGIDPLNVIVTTLDSDHRPHPKYLSAVTYAYCACPDPLRISFQPIPMFTNNIWDAPAPMRVIATGNSFWMMVVALRPHLLRNFASHSQSMQTLIDTDFWSVRTIVEDGHQFWRTYFRYDGNHDVHPIFLPVFQDAVFTEKFTKTLKTQFIQLRRWAWGASDVAYVWHHGFRRKNNISKLDLTFKFARLLEGHVNWAVAPLILAFSAFIPVLFNNQDIAAYQLPIIASRIQTVAMVGIAETLFLGFKMLPPKPERYKKHRTVFMALQWLYLPFTSILYYSLSALNSQTRLIFGRYIGQFDATEKAVVTDQGISGMLRNE